ncbi:hypothetical protein JG687_00014994 [Phytophthora cactorum]|uniref:Uncharacterized protein n=1 Tax=Phytophthora cactorum TaxID=29920 RepID=A0A8T1TXD9_9STRA|nr:hypothetical protein JG687_00014994 [Phytophthora cactorum]
MTPRHSAATPLFGAAPTRLQYSLLVFKSALPGVSEEALSDIVDEVATAASDHNLAMSATQLASVTKALVCAMVQRPRSYDQGFWDQFNRAQTVEKVSSAITAGTEKVFDTSSNVGKLRARLDSAYASRQALEVQLLTQTGLRENAELFVRQATAEIEELKTEFKETTEKLRKLIKSVQEPNLSIQKQVQREREVFQAKVVANAKQMSKIHRLLSDLIKGDSSDIQALQSKVAVQRDRIHRLTRANGILRQQVDLRAMDADTLVLATEGIASGDINLDLLDLGQSTRDALAQLQQLDAAAGVSTPLELNIAKAVHPAKKPGKRRRLHRAGSSSESSPSSSSDSEDSKHPHRKPSGSPKAALAAAGLANVPGISSDPSPSKRRSLRMPKAWRNIKPAK